MKPDSFYKIIKANMTKSFSQLFEESLKKIEIRSGSIVRSVVLEICKDIVLVDSGLKSESAIPIEQFKNAKGELEIQIGEEIDVVLDSIENGFGETLLSREKAKRYEAWISLEKAYKNSDTILGIINGKVKGGFTVEINGIRAFLPGSLVDIRPIRDTFYLENKEIEFKIIKLDRKRNNIVVSRRAVIESDNNEERNYLIKNLQEGVELKGIVKNLTEYGVFIDLGGIDGLLHITDMAWKRIKHPSEIVSIGNTITVKVLKFDRERVRVSLGLKQLSEDPWISITKRYLGGKKLTGRVTNLTDYGCFVEIEEGIEGLVHVSEMNWTNKNFHPSKIVNVGDIVEVMILDIDKENRRISLGMKQCIPNPWKQFSKLYKKGDHVKGNIKSITDFGIFIGLNGGIDGLIHLSDISWDVTEEGEVLKKYKKGDEITAVILQIDSDRERISLGIKQLSEDPLNIWISTNKKGTIVIGRVTHIDIKKRIIVELSNKIEGYLRVSELSSSKSSENTILKLQVGDKIKVKVVGIDRKNRLIVLSFPNSEKNNEKNFNSTISNLDKKEENFQTNVMVEAFKTAKGE